MKDPLRAHNDLPFEALSGALLSILSREASAEPPVDWPVAATGQYYLVGRDGLGLMTLSPTEVRQRAGASKWAADGDVEPPAVADAADHRELQEGGISMAAGNQCFSVQCHPVTAAASQDGGTAGFQQSAWRGRARSVVLQEGASSSGQISMGRPRNLRPA